MSIASALGDRWLGIPVWILLAALGGGLYLYARRLNSQSVPVPSDVSLGTVGDAICPSCGTPAAPMGPATQPNPNYTNGINAQPGVGTLPSNALYVPTFTPAVSGGDNPWVGGYVGTRHATPYDYARGGPS